jgi:hypothetical protein
MRLLFNEELCYDHIGNHYIIWVQWSFQLLIRWENVETLTVQRPPPQKGYWYMDLTRGESLEGLYMLQLQVFKPSPRCWWLVLPGNNPWICQGPLVASWDHSSSILDVCWSIIFMPSGMPLDRAVQKAHQEWWGHHRASRQGNILVHIKLATWKGIILIKPVSCVEWEVNLCLLLRWKGQI